MVVTGETSEVRCPSHAMEPGVQAITMPCHCRGDPGHWLSCSQVSPRTSLLPSPCMFYPLEGVCAQPTPGGVSCPPACLHVLPGALHGGLPLVSPFCVCSAISLRPCAHADAGFALWSTHCITFHFTVPALAPGGGVWLSGLLCPLPYSTDVGPFLSPGNFLNIYLKNVVKYT